MASKYARFDSLLFAWLRQLRAQGQTATTADAIRALGVKNRAQQRHISRRFTQLEDRGVLKCTLTGTTRVCAVVAEVPGSLAKKHWRNQINIDIKNMPSQLARKEADAANVPAMPSIRASNSSEFVRNGGIIEKLPSHWDNRPKGSKPLGDSFSFDE